MALLIQILMIKLVDQLFIDNSFTHSFPFSFPNFFAPFLTHSPFLFLPNTCSNQPQLLQKKVPHSIHKVYLPSQTPGYLYSLEIRTVPKHVIALYRISLAIH